MISPTEYTSVEIRDGLVFKTGDPQVLALEALKTGLAGEVGENSGLFSVPRFVSLDGGTLATEFVPRMKDLRTVAIERREGAEEIFARLGHALAVVHQELKLPREQCVPLPEFLMSRNGDDVVCHGDFFWGNVGWIEEEQGLVLLDWAGAPLLGGKATYGSRYFDLLWFSWSFFFWTPPRWIFRWQPERLVTALTRGYAEGESKFDWKQYAIYRTAIRPLLARYWRSKRKLVPSSPPHTIAEVIGALRWFLFTPRSGVG